MGETKTRATVADTRARIEDLTERKVGGSVSETVDQKCITGIAAIESGKRQATCYHPLLLFNREVDCLAAKLRPGSVYSADDWEELV